MKNESIWLEDIPTLSMKLDKDLDVDVLIVGGGLSGMSCAYHLKDSNLTVALVEANLIGRGVTSRTTAKLTFLQEDIYSKIKKYVGLDSSRLYYKSQKEAINIVQDIIEENKIDCCFTKADSHFFTEDSLKLSVLRDEKKILESFGEKVYEDISLPSGEKIKYSIYCLNTYVFHPLKYLYGLKKVVEKNIPIYEESRIFKIEKNKEGYLCKTKNNIIKAKKVIIASHYPYFLLPFMMVSKVSLEKSYIEALQVDKSFSFSAINSDNPVKSIRYHDDGENKYKIFLYGSRNLCIKNNEKSNFSKLDNFSTKYSYRWSNIDVMTGDYLPYIGKIDDNLFIATGYNTWGMTNGSLAGKVISDIILGRENEYIDLFDPKRKLNMGKIIKFPLVLGSNFISYVYGFKKMKTWYNDNIKYEKRNGKGVFIYTDNDGVEHIVYSNCPHLGCGLLFNEVELTWDCPCHGSRFDIDGKCIEGPSNYDISYK